MTSSQEDSSFICFDSSLSLSSPSSVTVNSARAKAQKLTTFQKRLKLSIFLAHRFRPFKFTCSGMCHISMCQCPILTFPIVSFVVPSIKQSHGSEFSLSKCEIDLSMRLLESRSNNELNLLMDAIIDLEVIDCLSALSTEKILLDACQCAIKTLSHAIHLARFSLKSSKEFIETLTSLNCLQNVQNSLVNESTLEMAYNSFTSTLQSRFKSQKNYFDRLAKYFSIFFNNYLLPLPSKQQFSNLDEATAYNSIYFRWILGYVIPRSCKCFVKLKMMDILIFQHIKIIFPLFRSSLLEQLESEQKLVYNNQSNFNDSIIRYILLPEYLDYLERKFISQNFEFWSTSNDKIDERLKINKRCLELTELEDAHLEFFKKTKTANTNTVETLKYSSLKELNLSQHSLTREKYVEPSSKMSKIFSLKEVKFSTLRFFIMSSSFIDKFNRYLTKIQNQNLLYISELKQIISQLNVEQNNFSNTITDIHFKIVKNGLQIHENEKSMRELVDLLDLVNIINIALPNMGVEYIAKLVFDPRHQSLLSFKDCQVDKGNEVPESSIAFKSLVGGITFRLFSQQGFSEIVFVTICPNEQVKGYGSKMMNELKDYHLKMGIYYLLTFADCRAIPFFVKQGFSEVIKLPKMLYKGFIKDYQGAQLMECQLNPFITYITFYEKILYYRSILLKFAEDQERGKRFSKPRKRDFLSNIISLSEIQKIFPNKSFNTILVDFIDHSVELNPKLKEIVHSLELHKNMLPSLLRCPTRESNYLEVVTYPMDLNTISNRISSCYYKNVLLFHIDIKRMFDNFRMFYSNQTKHLATINELQCYYATQMKAQCLVNFVSRHSL